MLIDHGVNDNFDYKPPLSDCMKRGGAEILIIGVVAYLIAGFSSDLVYAVYEGASYGAHFSIFVFISVFILTMWALYIGGLQPLASQNDIDQ